MKINQNGSTFEKIRFYILGYGISHIVELSDTYLNSQIYLVGKDKPWMAALLCPCGCGDVIQISLLKDDSPSWRFKRDILGRPSVSPSIWRSRGCRSHFFISHGQILWHHNSR